MDKDTIFKHGDRIKYDGLDGRLYHPNQDQNEAWLVIEDGNPQKMNWQKLWAEEPIDFAPNTNYADLLGIDLNAMEWCRVRDDDTACPFCNAKYTNRFEQRSSKQNCYGCKGNGERALYAEALLEAWLEEIRENRDISMAEKIENALAAGVWQLEVRRTIRALKTCYD